MIQRSQIGPHHKHHVHVRIHITANDLHEIRDVVRLSVQFHQHPAATLDQDQIMLVQQCGDALCVIGQTQQRHPVQVRGGRWRHWFGESLTLVRGECTPG